MKKLLAIFLFFFTCCNAFATNYYFAASGNDANAGTSTGAPWQTIAKFNSVFASKSPGDQFLFNRGDVFYGAMIISRSGTLGSPIIIGAYGTGANPVITGFTSVTIWTNLGSNIWESTSAVSTLNSCMMVLINGVNTPMGRFPNTGYFPYQSSTLTTKTSTSINSATINWTGAKAYTRYNNWVSDNDTITAHSGSTFTHTYHSAGSYTGIANYGFFIENDARTLDVQNEWYYSPSTHKIRIFSTSMPGTIQVSTIDTLVYMHQYDFITLDGIDFTGSNKDAIMLPGSQNVTIQNCGFYYHGKDAIWGANNFGANSAQNFILQNCSFNHINNYGINTESEFTNELIQNNTFKNIGIQPGMEADGSGNYNTAVAIIVHASGTVVQGNIIDSVGYSGIAYYGSNITINNNIVQHFCMTKIDGGGIYTWFGPGARSNRTNQVVNNNIVMYGIGSVAGTTQSVPLVHGIYSDDGSGNIEEYGNTVAFCSYSGFYVHNDSVMNIHDNTAYNNGVYQILATSYTTSHPLRNLVLKNNIFFSLLSTTKVASFESGNTDVPSWGSGSTIDSNYYARPLDDNLTIQTIAPGGTQRTFAGWQTYSGYDPHGGKSPKAVTSTDSILFLYNWSGSPVIYTLAHNYEDVRGIQYNGVDTLQPYTSAVLIQNGPITGGVAAAPTVNAGVDQSISVTTATLTASATHAIGHTITYSWSRVSGTGGTITSPSSASTGLTGLSGGVYTYQVKVTQDDGQFATDDVQVTVTLPNIPPVADAGSDFSIASPVNFTTLNGSGTDSDGSIVSYSWIQLSGPSSTIVSPASAITTISGLTTDGIYTYQLMVTDNSGATNSNTVNVTVTGNTIDIPASPNIMIVNGKIIFK